ncbi:hypothetical protein FOPE_12360 [Fonsecaea pedrosoi]|nr:hypothetical protein FOPE_12360 [Fonsecaea pedrosoi]
MDGSPTSHITHRAQQSSYLKYESWCGSNNSPRRYPYGEQVCPNHSGWEVNLDVGRSGGVTAAGMHNDYEVVGIVVSPSNYRVFWVSGTSALGAKRVSRRGHMYDAYEQTDGLQAAVVSIDAESRAEDRYCTFRIDPGKISTLSGSYPTTTTTTSDAPGNPSILPLLPPRVSMTAIASYPTNSSTLAV